jgi:hypothetical protein
VFDEATPGDPAWWRSAERQSWLKSLKPGDFVMVRIDPSFGEPEYRRVQLDDRDGCYLSTKGGIVYFHAGHCIDSGVNVPSFDIVMCVGVVAYKSTKFTFLPVENKTEKPAGA